MTWPEILHIVGPAISLATVVAGFITWLYRRHISALEKQIADLKDECDERLLERDELRNKVMRADLHADRLHAEKMDQVRAARDLQERLQELTDDQAAARAVNATLQRRAEAAEAEAARLQEREQGWNQYKADLEKERLELQGKTADGSAQITRLTQELQASRGRVDELLNELKEFREARRQLEQEVAAKRAELDAASAERFDLRQQLNQLSAQLDGAAEQTGRVWERPLAATAPPFVPLAERRTPIISVINLKGGVGKTTLTANLGAMLGLHGKRVLLIDLDYQRSLSLMCCTPRQIEQLHLGGRCLQHLLLHVRPDWTKLLSCMFTVPTADGCEVVAASEARTANDAAATLEDAEMRLMARWLVGGGPEVRTLLRGALHCPQLAERFDYVLLDCPPRFSTACLNALAASDFALVPVQLDRTSAVSAPNLLRKLKRLRDGGILPDLQVLGVVANMVRFYNGNPVATQATVWDEIQVPCRQAWDAGVHFFDTMLKQSSAVAQAAERHDQERTTGTFAAFQDDLKGPFTDLMHEVTKRIAHASKRPAAVPA